jgi:hypothetical protein
MTEKDSKIKWWKFGASWTIPQIPDVSGIHGGVRVKCSFGPGPRAHLPICSNSSRSAATHVALAPTSSSPRRAFPTPSANLPSQPHCLCARTAASLPHAHALNCHRSQLHPCPSKPRARKKGDRRRGEEKKKGRMGDWRTPSSSLQGLLAGFGIDFKISST